jgi:hypothetical protein
MQPGYLDQPSRFLQRIADFLGAGRLDFDQREADERRLIYASALPLLVLLIDVGFLLLQALKDIPYRATDYGNWWRLYVFLSTISGPLLVASVVTLILFAIYPVTRPQGSFAFLLAILLLICAAALVLFAAIVRAAEISGSAETDFLAPIWQNFGYDFCFLAIGYAFIAFRGLGWMEMGRRRTYGLRRRGRKSGS